MDKEVVLAILGLGTSAIAALRWLIHVYITQAKNIENLRDKNQRLMVEKLESSIHELEHQLKGHRAEMIRVQERLTLIQSAITKNTQDGEALIKSLSDYIDATVSRMNRLESQIVEISKRLVIVKGGGSGGQGN